MNVTNRFKLEIYNNELEIVNQLDVLNTKYELELKSKSFYQVTCKESLLLDQVYFCQIGDIFGRIMAVTEQEDSYNYKIAIFEDAFDYEVSFTNNQTDSLENMIKDLLEQYNNKLFSYIKKFNINCLSHTPGFFLFKETMSFSELLSSIRRLYNIQLEIVFKREGEITINIVQYEQNIFDIVFNDRKVIKYNANFSIENPTMVTIVDNFKNSYNFYLCANGEIDNEYEPSPEKVRLPVIKNEIKIVDERIKSLSEAQHYAEEILYSSENNEVIIEYDSSDVNEFFLLGTFVRFWLPNGVSILTSISKIESENDSPVKTLTLGATRKNFIDKLKNMKGMIISG